VRRRMAKLRRKMVMWLKKARERACERELEKIAERLAGRKCEFARMIGNEPKNFVFADADLCVCGGRYRIYGWAVVENPEFWASPWWRESPFVRFEGKYVVLEMTYAGAVWVYALLRIVQ